ncbi:AN1-type zinc finger protein 2B isoform X4 [Pyrgilauda ruficollis]|uniref:AN1-type zinc finger protein 2B isoform X4 n=1 Tax=Pyrgilauda ruficollis TaxID=221976 RepID=UPI001B862605|nr:AN1-type zinc finger protein 2B isoform X4 [Pyrgilauda ruficollis]
MEFPDLGAHCSWPACQRLDFLPLKCDACEQIFCTDHITYAQHDCTSAYKKSVCLCLCTCCASWLEGHEQDLKLQLKLWKPCSLLLSLQDVQVPVCPLCNTPVPVRRGEMPDVVVGEHIDRDCKSDPAQRKRKIFTNKCLKPGCKQKEMMKVICDQCHKNYCLKHRHPLDHDCSGAGHPLSKAGHAAVTRAQASSSKIVTASSSGAARPADSSSSLACARARKRHCSELWRCPWQSRHAAQHSNPAHRRRRIWHWPRHCQRAKPSTSSRSGRHTVQSHPTAPCRRQVRRGVPADTASCL